MAKDYKVICDRSGFEAWRSECKLEWDGKLVLKEFWMRKNPLDFATPEATPTPIENPRPESPDYFVGNNEVKASNL